MRPSGGDPEDCVRGDVDAESGQAQGLLDPPPFRQSPIEQPDQQQADGQPAAGDEPALHQHRRDIHFNPEIACNLAEIQQRRIARDTVSAACLADLREGVARRVGQQG
jgi:hypothetical protein